jgi:hypothetical protein
MTPEQAQQLFDYSPDTGEIRWKRGRHCAGGRVAGTRWENGYIRIRIDGKYQYAHRIAWAITHGYWPEMLDHANGNKEDNRLDNLRECSKPQNSANSRSPKPQHSSQYRGVSWHKQRQKWCARLTARGKRYALGLHATEVGAAVAHDLKAIELHGQFATLNFAGMN